MSTFAIDVSELTNYANALEANAGVLPGAADVVITRWSNKIVQYAKRIVPVDTGALRASIRFNPTTRTVEAVGGAQGRVYAGFVEFGTSRMAARPYLRPAMEKYRQPYINDLERTARSLLTGRTAGGRAAATGGLFKGAISHGQAGFSLKQQLAAGQYVQGG